ncbi:hypothetical protein GIB67_007588 [Kingdonia uniflora]|uniref:Reticulon-like protein n=1 Tax=Kingdonia uniflora TaxID=39325 RepID=A0A7J7N1F4_9MAGN|nr:hypothetical protein GIB67_007588 [Kingdonia uniflora]
MRGFKLLGCNLVITPHQVTYSSNPTTIQIYKPQQITVSQHHQIPNPSMGSKRLFNRERSIHDIFGGGLCADVVLWRRKNVTMGILLVALSAWVVFEKSGYTVLSLVSNVFLLLFAILFFWAKSAAILSRPPPPLPDLQISEEVINEAAAFICSHMNTLLSVSRDISLGRDSKLFYKLVASLLLISVVGSWTDFLTLCYTSLFVLLTVPAFYAKYDNQIDTYIILAYKETRRLYMRLDAECFSNIKKMIIEKWKLS